MKIILILFIAFASSHMCSAKLGPEWISDSEKLAEKVREHPDKVNVIELGRRLIGVEQYNTGTTEELKAISVIVDTLIAIPDHGRWFSEEIEDKRASVANLSHNVGGKVDYDRKRSWYIGNVFHHLPSPEIIKALGGFLNDDRDIPPPPGPDQDWVDIPANSNLASTALAKIGLVDPPAENLAAQRKWWEEVKSGKRTFAFLGKPVSYRFLPDGTTQTTPRDASRDPRRFPPPLDSDKASPAPTAVIRTPWVIGGALLLLGVLGYFLKKKSRA